MADIDLTPTEEMASNAARGLELREKHGKGGTAVGVARARDIKNRKNLSPDTVRRMHSFFSRHAGNEAGGEDDAGYISFLLWGGAAGRSWAKRKSAQLDKDENAMSDTRKAIMERLGMAGKVKSARIDSTMLDGSMREVPILLKDGGHAIARKSASGWKVDGHADIPAFAKLRDLVAHMDKMGFSRPGAKAKMAVEAGWRVNPEARTTGMSVQELLPKLAKGHRFWANLKDGSTVSGTLKAFNANAVQIDKYGDVRSIQWTDIASIGAGNIGTGPYPIRASRPGAKAKFAEDAREVAQEILRQLGGGRFMAMVGGKNAFHGTFGGKPGLQLDIGKGAEGGVNRLIVKLDRGSDTYDMEFWRVAKRGMDVKKVSEASGVYADDLQRIFTSRTKFYTSLSRTGAKEKFGLGIGEAFEFEGKVYVVNSNADTISSLLSSAKSNSEKAMMLAAYMHKGLISYEGKRKSSRPGAKAKMGKWESTLTKKHGKPIEEYTARLKGGMFKIEVGEGSGGPYAILYRWDDLRGLERIASGNLQSLMRQAESMGAKEARGVAAVERLANYSRPGAKAKMAKAQFRVRKLHGGYLAVDMNQGGGWERYDTTHEEVFDGLEDYERGYQKAYDRGLRWSGGAWRIPSTKASRPGAKATFAYADAEVRGDSVVWPGGMTLKIIKHSTLEQKSQAMQDAIARNNSKWVADYQLRGPRGAMYSLDVYSNGTYILTPHNKPHAALRGQLKSARPGAKAKFGNADALLSLADGYVSDGNDEAGLLLTDLVKMRNRGLLSADQSKQLDKIIRDARAMGVFSRPGAKAKMAKRYDAKIVGNELVRSDGRRYQITSRKPSLPKAREMLGEVEWLLMVGSNGAEYSVQRFEDGGYRVFGGNMGMSVQWDGLLRASRPGAKVRNAIREGEKVSASDDAVSRKIRKLMDEGKPQKQAVAIALDLERRGEL